MNQKKTFEEKINKEAKSIDYWLNSYTIEHLQEKGRFVLENVVLKAYTEPLEEWLTRLEQVRAGSIFTGQMELGMKYVLLKLLGKDTKPLEECAVEFRKQVLANVKRDEERKQKLKQISIMITQAQCLLRKDGLFSKNRISQVDNKLLKIQRQLTKLLEEVLKE